MSLFGVDPSVVRQMHGEMSEAILEQDREIKRLRTLCVSLEADKRELKESVRHRNADNRRLRTELGDQAEVAAKAVTKAREERDDYREKYEEELRRNGELEREDARRERLVVALQMDKDDLERQVEELEEENRELKEVADDQGEALVELQGALTGMVASAKIEAEARVATDPKTLRRGQAALAQSGRGGISTKARIAALERAEALLGELPGDHAQRLVELRGEVERKALPGRAPGKKRKPKRKK